MLFATSVPIDTISSWASTPSARKSTIEHLSRLRLLLKSSHPYVVNRAVEKERERQIERKKNGARKFANYKILVIYKLTLSIEEKLLHYTLMRDFSDK
jgi:hypothetical protein